MLIGQEDGLTARDIRGVNDEAPVGVLDIGPSSTCVQDIGTFLASRGRTKGAVSRRVLYFPPFENR